MRLKLPTCADLMFLELVIHIKEKKREMKGKEVKPHPKKQKKKKEKNRNFRIALHHLSPWFSPIIFAFLN